MRKILLLALLCFSGYAWGQEIRLNTYAGYVFKNRVDSYYSNSAFYDGTIQDGFRGGVGLEYHLDDLGAVEIQYMRQNTTAPTRYQNEYFGDIQFTVFDVRINWIMVNGTRYFPVNDVVEPFAGAGAGLGIFNIDNPDNGNSDSATKFSWQIRAGTNLWVAERIGIRLQASLVSAVQSIGGGLYFGTGGSGAGLSTYSTMYQFGLGGGVVLKF